MKHGYELYPFQNQYQQSLTIIKHHPSLLTILNHD